MEHACGRVAGEPDHLAADLRVLVLEVLIPVRFERDEHRIDPALVDGVQENVHDIERECGTVAPEHRECPIALRIGRELWYEELSELLLGDWLGHDGILLYGGERARVERTVTIRAVKRVQYHLHCMSGMRIIRILVWAAAALFLLALTLRDLQLDRRLDIVAQLDRATSYLSTFGPPSRVALSSQSSDGTMSDRAALSAEPVYVNLRIPRWFRRATVELEYENPSNIPFKLGVRTHPTQWAFHFPEPEFLPLKLPLPEGRGETAECSTPGVEQRCVRVPFELQRAWQVERNMYRFVLSAPGVSAERPIVVRGLRVVAERDAICLAKVCI